MINHTLLVSDLITILSKLDPELPISIDVSNPGENHSKWEDITFVDLVEGSQGEMSVLISARPDIDTIIQ